MSLISGFDPEGVVTVNRVILKPEYTLDDLQERVAMMCAYVKTMHSGEGIDGKGGFVGGLVLKNSGAISIEGSTAGKVVDTEMKDREFLIVTFWDSFEEHEESHKHAGFNKLFTDFLDLCETADEPVYEMLWQGSAYNKEDAEVARKTFDIGL